MAFVVKFRKFSVARNANAGLSAGSALGLWGHFIQCPLKKHVRLQGALKSEALRRRGCGFSVRTVRGRDIADGSSCRGAGSWCGSDVQGCRASTLTPPALTPANGPRLQYWCTMLQLR